MTEGRRQTGTIDGTRGARAWLVLPLVLVLLSLAAPATSAEPPPQPLVEAGFITKFPLFITWPDEPWRRGDAPFVIGVMGDSPVREHLDELAKYATIDGSPLVVRSMADLSGIDQCHLLFIADGAPGTLDEILAGVAGKPILTVSDCEGYASRGVHINFYLEGQYVRFEINQRASEAANLTVSFRLKNVARLVD